MNTIGDVTKHLQGMIETLERYKEKHPEAKFKWIKLSLDWGEFKDAKRDGDSIWYWSINGGEIWITLGFSTEEEEE